MKKVVLLFAFLATVLVNAQTAWPSQSWNAATPLTSVMNVTGVPELSGLHWNQNNNRLYSVSDDGRVRVLQLNTATNTFTQICDKAISGGPEGITQANLNANEFYVIDENAYEIQKYTHTSNFSSVTMSRHWNLLAAPSPMPDTGNTGPEGIVFIPDAALSAVNFVSSVTGQLYTSVNGAGGLFFIANQDGGYIWVFDINPMVNDNFAYVGKYKTNRTESCDLAFDRTTGLMYILHNVGSNYLEVTDLTLQPSASQSIFTKTAEYFISNPLDGNINIEGFAITPKCAAVTGSAWLCRDEKITQPAAVVQDVLRWFNPFAADGDCTALSVNSSIAKGFEITAYPNPGSTEVTISIGGKSSFSVKWINILGQVVLKKDNANGNTFDISLLDKGVYIIEVKTDESISKIKWIKN